MKWVACLIILTGCGVEQHCLNITGGLCFINRSNSTEEKVKKVLSFTQERINAYGVVVNLESFFEDSIYSVEYVKQIGDSSIVLGRSYGDGRMLVKQRDEQGECQTLSHEILHQISDGYMGISLDINQTHQQTLMFKVYCARKYRHHCNYEQTVEGQIEIMLAKSNLF